jgi:hypothetical protein
MRSLTHIIVVTDIRKLGAEKWAAWVISQAKDARSSLKKEAGRSGGRAYRKKSYLTHRETKILNEVRRRRKS